MNLHSCKGRHAALFFSPHYRMLTFDYLQPAFDAVRPAWQQRLLQPDTLPTLHHIDAMLSADSARGDTIYPPRSLIFHALHYCDPQAIRVVILGQDPYHGEGEAMGLSFSVPAQVRIPPSLRNVFKELQSDLGCCPPPHGDLSNLARQGVLLLNSALTVSANRAGSHAKLGWQRVTDALIDEVNRASPACVFMLWGAWAQGKADRIDTGRHRVLLAPHPSPLAAYRGFFGCHHFSLCNQWLQQHAYPQIDWCGSGFDR